MNKEELQERITKAEEKLVKLNNNKEKYYSKLSDQAKKYADLDLSYIERRRLNLDFDDEINLDYYYQKKSEIEQTESVINKYKNLLKQQDELIDIPVLKEFIENWKKATIDYYINLSDAYIQREKDLYKKYYTDQNRSSLNKEGYYEYSQEYRNLINNFGSYIVSVVQYGKHKNNKIMKDIENEAGRRYRKLVNKVSDIVGIIENCDHLRMASDGSINGIIIGDKGKAKVETVVAGGRNEHIIVNVRHGQIAHYRVLVKKLN